tara:strand:- start:3480 stop:3947 length:468 start_codon:yes stop_codon:yes gene_type:complete
MAYLKLQVSKGIAVSPSDSTPLPNPEFIMTTGTTTATTASKLVDSGAAFTTTVEVGNIVINTTDNTMTNVTAVDSDTTLSVADDIFTTGEDYTIYKQAEKGGAILYVGGSGNIKLDTSSGSTLTFNGLNAGTFVPVQTVKVYNTGTTATNIIALW